jgi:protein gp37
MISPLIKACYYRFTEAAMNITRIGWCNATINPCVGCPHGCDYCYARGQAKRAKQRCRLCYEFVPHPHLERLNKLTPGQKPKRIFLDSMWDWNARGVKREWLLAILKKIRECPQHTFQILSKRPARYSRFTYPEHVWLGTSMATNADLHTIDELIQAVPNNLRFVSIEPIHGRIDHDFHGLGWIIIGAETGHRKGKVIPEKPWISEIIKKASAKHIPIFIKDNVNWNQTIREFPR